MPESMVTAEPVPTPGTGAEDLERRLLERRRELHGDGLARDALAGQAVALAHEVGSELDFVADGRRRRRAGRRT